MTVDDRTIRAAVRSDETAARECTEAGVGYHVRFAEASQYGCLEIIGS